MSATIFDQVPYWGLAETSLARGKRVDHCVIRCGKIQSINYPCSILAPASSCSAVDIPHAIGHRSGVGQGASDGLEVVKHRFLAGRSDTEKHAPILGPTTGSDSVKICLRIKPQSGSRR